MARDAAPRQEALASESGEAAHEARRPWAGCTGGGRAGVTRGERRAVALGGTAPKAACRRGDWPHMARVVHATHLVAAQGATSEVTACGTQGRATPSWRRRSRRPGASRPAPAPMAPIPARRPTMRRRRRTAAPAPRSPARRRPRPMVARRATAAARPRARRRPTRTIRTTRRRRCGAPQPAHPGQRPAPGAHPLKGRAGRVALPPPAALRRRWGHPHAHVPPARPARAPPRVAALTAVCPRARRTAGGWRCGGPRASAARGCARCGAPTRTASRARSRTPRPPWPTGVRPSPQQLKKDCSAVRS